MSARLLAITVPCALIGVASRKCNGGLTRNPGGALRSGRVVMRVRVRKSFKAAPGARARANAKDTGVVPGGKGYIALVLLALALTACGGQPSPSPAGTSLGPSPSLTGTSRGPSPSPTDAAWACVTSSPKGTCGYYTTGSTITMSAGNTYDANNCWADPSCVQTLSSNSPGDWQVTSTEPAGNTSVRTGPELQQQTNNWCPAENTWQNLTKDGCGGKPLSNVPISALHSLTSTYSESMPHNGQTVAEAAYDIWTNYKSDIMIWLDNVNRHAGGATQIGTASIGGQNFTVYRFGSTGGEIIFSLDGAGGTNTFAQQSSGSVDILGVLDWVQSHGYASNMTMSLLDFTFEICSTGGAPETFGVSSYSVTAKAA